MDQDAEPGVDFATTRSPEAEPSRLASGAVSPRRKGADPYDAIVWRLRACEENPGTGFTVGVMGCARRSGATTVAANAAIRFADNGLGPVLLAECNSDHRSLARAFRLGRAAGLGEIIAGQAELAEGIHETKVDSLDVMPLGAAGLFGRASGLEERFSSLLAELRGEYAVIVLDLPSADRIVSALPVAQQVDAALLVLRSESVKRRTAKEAVRQLAQDGIPVVGSVVTRRKNYTPRWLGGGA